jgi:signal transduction histidine kinase
LERIKAATLPRLLLALVMLCFAVVAQAAPDDVITFRQGALAFSTDKTPPQSGWEARALPQLILTDEAQAREKGGMSVWVRTRFDAAALPREPLAFYTVSTRERFVAYLNGVEFHRNYGRDSDQVLNWNRPVLAPIPSRLLRPGVNELIVHVDTGVRWHLGVGTLAIGPVEQLRDVYETQYFWRISGVRIANGIMLAGMFYAFFLWVAGWRDRRALLIAGISLFWVLRNLHFYVLVPPFDADLFRSLSQYLIYFVVALTYAFCAEVFNIRRRVLFNALQFGFAIAVCLLRAVLISRELPDVICNILTLLTGLTVIYISAREYWRSRSFDHFLILSAIIVATLFSLHDIGLTSNVQAWHGAGFFLQPYAGVIMAGAFFLSLGRNYVQAFADINQMNEILGEKVAAVTEALTESEAKRREQEVVLAVDRERQRLMSEMHDGIGSNLVTALAIAQRQNESPRTIATLQRALSDLKITVDSLAPVEGDVVALLANLKHRMEPDLSDAGLTIRWRVGDCPPLPWLDATNALQMLRIIQEGIANILAHARATRLEIDCQPHQRGDREGIRIVLADNGRGFDPSSVNAGGQGLANMAARAKTMHGQFDIVSAPDKGTRLRLWLPLERRATPRF